MKLKPIAVIICIMLIISTGCGNKNKPEDTGTPSTTDKTENVTQEPEPEPSSSDTPTIEPADVELPDFLNDGTASMIKVYVVKNKEIQDIKLNEYLYGVVAGEVGNDWPEEVLKAQAIIARTFMLDFFLEKESSKYEGADISTDVSESQAYNKEDINDAIKKAVDDTTGVIITYEEKPIKAFFHSCSGGMTATAVEGLDHKEELPYIQAVESDSSNAPAKVQDWSSEYTKEKLLTALADMEEDIADFDTIEIAEKGPSGRCITLSFGEAKITCSVLRIKLSASDFRSTLLTELVYEDNILKVTGKGFGHGVGMPQWDAKQMAEDGKNAHDIINYYFKDVKVVQAWE